MLKRRGNEILDETGKQLAIVLAVNVPKSTAARWAQYIVDRENSVRRADENRKANNTHSVQL